MAKFKTYLGRGDSESTARIIIEAVRSGRRWMSIEADDIGNMGELAMVTEEWLNDGNKLSDPEAWEEISRAA